MLAFTGGAGGRERVGYTIARGFQCSGEVHDTAGHVAVHVDI